MSTDIAQDLHAQRNRAWEAAKQILERSKDDNDGVLSAEDEQAYQRANETMDRLDARIKDVTEAEQRRLDAEEALANIHNRSTPPAGGTPPPASPGDEHRDREEAAVRSVLRGDKTGVDCKLSAQDYRLLQARSGMLVTNIDPTQETVRDLTTQTTTSGGDTIPRSFSGMLMAHLIETATVAKVSTVLTTDGGEPYDWPVTTSHSTATLTGENTPLTESDPAFTKRTLGAYKYAVAVQVPRELLDDTGVDLTGYLAMQMGRACGNKLGTDLAVGDGSSKPNGIVNGSTLGETGGTGVSGAFTADDLIDLYHSVIGPYRARPKCAWMMRDATLATLRKIQDGASQYIWQPSLSAGAPDTLFGKPIHTDPNIAAVATSAKSVIFGDLGSYITRLAGGMRFERSDDYAFGSDQVTFRAIIRGDGILADQTGAVKHFLGGSS